MILLLILIIMYHYIFICIVVYIIKYITVLIIISYLTMYIRDRKFEFQMLIKLILMVKMIEMEKSQFYSFRIDLDPLCKYIYGLFVCVSI